MSTRLSESVREAICRRALNAAFDKERKQIERTEDGLARRCYKVRHGHGRGAQIFPLERVCVVMILGPNFRRDRTLPFKRMADVQPQSPPTRAPIGRTPWYVDKDTGVITDRDGNSPCTAVSVEMARVIATAVNSFAPLNAEWGMLTDVLKALQADLRTGTPEEANKRARALIDGVLTPKESTQSSAEREPT